MLCQQNPEGVAEIMRCMLPFAEQRSSGRKEAEMRSAMVAMSVWLLAGICPGDTIVMKDGRELQGKITGRFGGEIAIRTAEGKLVVIKAEEMAKAIRGDTDADKRRTPTHEREDGTLIKGSGRTGKKRWVYMPCNLLVNENLAKLQGVLERAKAVGYSGVLFYDSKALFWWKLQAAELWERNAKKLRQVVRQLGLELVVGVFPFGYSSAFLWHDANLAAGMPVRETPMVAQNGELVPVQTAEIKNGSFESYRGHRAEGLSLQDNPGTASFIDTKIVKHGKASLRFEDVARANNRVSQTIDVKPWQQYRLRAWMKAENLTASSLGIVVLADKRMLQHQWLVTSEGDRTRYVRSARNLNTDWVEQSVTFNSLGNTSVYIFFGVWGGKAGKIWWDDLRIDTVPTLNLLRRDSLPLTIHGEDGMAYEEGRDFARVEDPCLGRSGKTRRYDTRHEPPVIRLAAESRIRDGQKVRFSGYHAALTNHGFVSASLCDPKVFDLCALQIRKTEEALSPDGYFMSHDEIRCAGWEPEAVRRFSTSGELLAYNVRRCYEIAHREGGGKPVYVFSDMFDPNHNARADYFLVNNTIEGSWNGLDQNVVVMTWGGEKYARPGLEFFGQRNLKQMIAAYHDRDVVADHKMWTEAARGVPDIIGVMYTTGRSDYRNLEKFAEIWWGGE